jgi:hypothetical protein
VTNPNTFPQLLRLALHAYDGPSSVLDISDCPIGVQRRLLVLSGLAVTQANLQWLGFGLFPQGGGGAIGDGGYAEPPIRIGPPLRTLQPPLVVPEPGTGGGLLAAAVLAGLARRRRG